MYQKYVRLISFIDGSFINIRKFSKMSGSKNSETPVANSIRNNLSERLKTHYLEVINESYMHNVPKGSETHFKVIVVSDQFCGLPLIKQHKLVYDILQNEIRGGVHALSIITKTPEQWKNSSQTISPSPKCRNGFGK